MAYQKVILEGNLTRDIEIRYSQSGSAIANTGIAVGRKWKTQSGEQKEEVMFIDLTFFSRQAEIANQYLRKGSKVLIDGRLQFQQWTAQDGTKRSKHAITVENLQMLDSKADSQNQTPQQQSQGQGYSQPQPNQGQGGYGHPNTTQQPTQPSVPEIDIDDSEIPF